MLVGILLSALIPTGAFTVSAGLESKVFGKYTYNVDEDRVTIVDVESDISGEVVIPTSIEGYPVTGIDERAFDGCDQIVTLKIPAKVSVIAEAAFENCSSLTEFIVGFDSKSYMARDGVLYSKDKTTLICYPAGKADTAFAVPDGVKTVDVAAFQSATKLESLTVANGVEKISNKAFYGCSGLKRVVFGVGLTEIGDEAFAECASLEAVTIPNSVTSLGRAAFSKCGALSEVTIGSGLKSLNGTMFLDCASLKTVTIPDNVEDILPSAFSGCSGLETITIPRTVTKIGAYTFSGCVNLKTVCYTGSEAEQSAMSIGAKNEPLSTAQWQHGAASVAPPAEDTPVDPQPIAGPAANVLWAWVMIYGVAVLIVAVVIVVIVLLVKGVKARK